MDWMHSAHTALLGMARPQWIRIFSQWPQHSPTQCATDDDTINIILLFIVISITCAFQRFKLGLQKLKSIRSQISRSCAPRCHRFLLEQHNTNDNQYCTGKIQLGDLTSRTDQDHRDEEYRPWGSCLQWSPSPCIRGACWPRSRSDSSAEQAHALEPQSFLRHSNSNRWVHFLKSRYLCICN